MSEKNRPKVRKPLPPWLVDQVAASPIGACFGYVRFSGNDVSAVPRQRSSINAYAATLGVEVARWYGDGPDGTHGVGGPGLRNLLVAACSGEFTDLIVEDHGRLTRDHHLLAIVLDVLEGAGIRLHAAAESRVSVRQDGHMGVRARLACLDRQRRSMLSAAGRRRSKHRRAIAADGSTGE